MPSVEYLREKALRHRPTLDYSICLDPDLRQQVDLATAALVQLQARRATLAAIPAEDRGAKSLADTDPLKQLDEQIAQAEQAVADAEASAADEVVVLHFARLAPDAHDEVSTAHARPDGILKPEYYPAVCAAAYVNATTSDGQDLDMDWPQAYAMLNTGDRDLIFIGVHNLHAQAAVIPFNLASSGRPGTSSLPA
ncbi:MAG: hypothetical protein HZY73_11325 [Micropruina sp.]|nr:MAG: hypothetical protein HZY73_11325 [Micropruina sp.]